MSYLDPKFRYHGAATHADGAHFRRRMKERIRAAQTARDVEQRKPKASVRPLRKVLA
jgi:hypothetical protein